MTEGKVKGYSIAYRHHSGEVSRELASSNNMFVLKRVKFIACQCIPNFCSKICGSSQSKKSGLIETCGPHGTLYIYIYIHT